MKEAASEDSNTSLGKTILVVDSGVGGLSICKSVLEACPSLSIRYVADDAAFPYGTKSERYLIDRLSHLIELCHTHYEFDLIVLACNTISTVVLPSLRAKFDIPIVGVVPAIKPAAVASRTGSICLLATPGTVSRDYTEQLVRDFAGHCSVLKIGSSVLVEEAERFLAGQQVNLDVLQEELEPLLHVEPPIDTVVLGCTHFPLLSTHLSELMPDLQWVDSGNAIARRVTELLGAACFQGEASHSILFTGVVPESTQFLAALKKLGFENVRLGSFRES